jgi:hypothetical protein
MHARATVVVAMVSLGLLLSVATLQVRGQSSGQKIDVAIYGAGNVSCGKWIADESPDSQMHPDELEWVMGFVSAVGWEGIIHADKPLLRQTDSDGIAQAIHQYCVQHPTDNLERAAEALVRTLRSPSGAKPDPLSKF